MCDACQLPGCQLCTSLDICQTCLDEEQTLHWDNQCICKDLNMKPNSDDACSLCDLHGCASCDAQDATQCFMSLDRSATIEGGVVVCPENQRLGTQGMCTTCMVVGCYQCVEGNPNECAQCKDFYGTTIIGGKCVCQNQFMKPRVDGICDYCAVDGCASCGKIINECVECEESRVLDEFQQCVTV